MSQQTKKKMRKTVGTKHLIIIYLQRQTTKKSDEAKNIILILNKKL